MRPFYFVLKYSQSRSCYISVCAKNSKINTKVLFLIKYPKHLFRYNSQNITALVLPFFPLALPVLAGKTFYCKSPELVTFAFPVSLFLFLSLSLSLLSRSLSSTYKTHTYKRQICLTKSSGNYLSLSTEYF